MVRSTSWTISRNTANGIPDVNFDIKQKPARQQSQTGFATSTKANSQSLKADSQQLLSSNQFHVNREIVIDHFVAKVIEK